MRPAGPLPPKVYWVRRLVLLLAVVLVLSVVWWLLAGSGSADPKASAASSAGATSSPSDPGASTEPVQRPRQQPAATTKTQGSGPTSRPNKPRQQAAGSGTSTKPRTPTKAKKTPLAQPTGTCSPTGVGMEIDVADSAPGEPNTATLLLTSTDSPACALAITPDDLVVRVTSGADVVWSSDDCPDLLRAKEIVVRADPPTAYEFHWNGRRSEQNCQPVDTLPTPGGYWVQAALIGGDPHKAYFDITKK